MTPEAVSAIMSDGSRLFSVELLRLYAVGSWCGSAGDTVQHVTLKQSVDETGPRVIFIDLSETVKLPVLWPHIEADHAP